MNGHRAAAVALTICTTLLISSQAAAPSAWADRTSHGGAGSEVKGGASGRVITAQTRVRTSVHGGGTDHASATGSPSPVGVAWTPPACWYEPAFSPKEIESTVKAWRAFGVNAPLVGGIGHVISAALEHRYKDGHPYKNYNLSKQGEGIFWASVINPNRQDDPEATSCDRQPFWVDEGQTPAEPMAASPEILAQYAYDELPVPGTEIKMAPRARSTVNLPTWVWLDEGRFKKISVTASLPGTGLSATTTAEPESLHIDPGTPDATRFPASGGCAPRKGGGIGEPYARGKAETAPPCGVTYLRSTAANETYALRATLTWKIRWSSSTGEGGGLPSGSFGATQRIPVQEIQSVNR
ncbi:hypothetical protein GCM10009837_64490 [Streptomyces durmitorensis]|uniref:Enoyl reductase n=1 Tax=Streptomyces durmitorensis TaxID=319947 RepID=A0ABY4PT38_9ACTN|nr:hypothetical protein [Streptomyces durmitorensis]UQT57002.1 hypothetical protein M4V62_18900 [Streptomyces durmitorensis]